ncbi:hypothetical protein [Novosphingobium terrae]|jgi:hypothetical protein|uniref:hypothetical protein n=1 Tax=Novosphingobium terrae TaxID=2726189 RepID=UPI00197F1617|nr:hypothetical protein [Novosphingobium terrae]
MTMTISAATARLARQLPQAEQDIDQALMALTTLLNSMVAARSAEGVAPGTGEMAIQHVGKAIEGLISASGEVAKAHGRLRKIHQETGLADIGDCPSGSATLTETARLAV